MDPAVEFERCIGVVATSAARTAKRIVDPEAVPPLPVAIVPQPGTPAHELAVALALAPDEVEFVWSVIGRAVEPLVAAHAREVFGADARVGVSLAQHIAWRELPAERSRMLLAVLDAHHRLRTGGILVPVGAEPFDVQTPWTSAERFIATARAALAAAGDHESARVQLPAWTVQRRPDGHRGRLHRRAS
jgi:hypothetical protein